MKSSHQSTAGVSTAVIGSMTAAMKAQQVLSAAAIRSNVVKTESGTKQRGCVYGITFSSLQRANVQKVLSNAHIHVRGFLD